ncbi:MAG TPA: galactose oxidase early set domain-containing protein, partial [Rugosimonospora sp.]|nr:galactose oxidase early set domain-containing protein [Rugosimonospora sp.]
NDALPAWRYTGAMQYPRRHLNAVLLPDGTVLATGGSQDSGFATLAGAVLAAEQWSPVTETWTTLAPSQVARVYHSSSVLLPDGRVLHTGSGDGANLPRELNAELFSPPYLFRGRRPVITAAPATVAYGEQFTVATPDWAVIAKVSWIRLPSVTHAFDQNQRFNWLTFEAAPGGVTVTAPAGPALAPPGHYMLFLLNGDGVPSIAKIVNIQ